MVVCTTVYEVFIQKDGEFQWSLAQKCWKSEMFRWPFRPASDHLNVISGQDICTEVISWCLLTEISMTISYINDQYMDIHR